MCYDVIGQSWIQTLKKVASSLKSRVPPRRVCREGAIYHPMLGPTLVKSIISNQWNYANYSSPFCSVVVVAPHFWRLSTIARIHTLMGKKFFQTGQTICWAKVVFLFHSWEIWHILYYMPTHGKKQASLSFGEVCIYWLHLWVLE